MRVQLVFAFVALLALGAVSARHVAKHKAHKQHAAHDLERVENAHRRRAARHYLHKELEEQKKYLLALDCGSSGTKMMVYGLTQGDCDAVSPTHKCKDQGMKITPGLKKIISAGVSTYFAAYDSKLKPVFGTETEGVIAKATAGNRIISTTQNSTTWTTFTAAGTGFPAWSALPVVASFGNPETLPGTMEAWLEWKAAVKQGQNGNFVSLGGASAQMAFKLTTLNLANAFKTKFASLSLTDLPCNNQQSLTDYACIVEAAPSVYRCLPDNEVASKCNGDKCVGLISWLAGKYVDADQPGCTLGDHHRAGGTNEVKLNFDDWVTGAGASHADACDDGKPVAGCISAVEAFIDGDKLLTAVNEFAGTYLSAASTAQWLAAGNMNTALNIVGPGTFDVSGNIKSGKSSGAFFYANGKALSTKAGVGSKMVAPASKIDWLDSAADILNYPFKCELPRIDNSVAECLANIA